MAKLESNAIGEDPIEEGPIGEPYYTNGIQSDNNRGDKGVVIFWHDLRITILDISITDVTSPGYQGKSTEQVLQRWENLKN